MHTPSISRVIQWSLNLAPKLSIRWNNQIPSTIKSLPISEPLQSLLTGTLIGVAIPEGTEKEIPTVFELKATRHQVTGENFFVSPDPSRGRIVNKVCGILTEPNILKVEYWKADSNYIGYGTAYLSVNANSPRINGTASGYGSHSQTPIMSRLRLIRANNAMLANSLNRMFYLDDPEATAA